MCVDGECGGIHGNHVGGEGHFGVSAGYVNALLRLEEKRRVLGGREGGREGGKEGGREGRREGGREGGKEGGKEGGEGGRNRG